MRCRRGGCWPGPSPTDRPVCVAEAGRERRASQRCGWCGTPSVADVAEAELLMTAPVTPCGLVRSVVPCRPVSDDAVCGPGLFASSRRWVGTRFVEQAGV